MPKNIVVCFDGTGNEFGEDNSNIVKLYATLVNDGERQLCFYAPGVGTFGQGNVVFGWQASFAKLLGKAFGWGVKRNVFLGYRFLMQHYAPGDRAFLFGFSRGAYIARSLAAVLHAVGLLNPDLPHLFDYAWKLFKRHSKRDGEPDFPMQARFKDAFSRPCDIHFLGLFDTVKSVGWVTSPTILPYTARNRSIGIVRHALSIDERRCYFRQNLWRPEDGRQDIKQVWFAGVHSDVGGGYPEKESGLAKIPLRWMLKESRRAGLLADDAKVARQLGETGENARPDPLARMHNSLCGGWWVAELIPRRYEDPANHYKRRYEWPIASKKTRFIAEGALLHASVLQRRDDAGACYRPTNLPAHYRIETDD